MIWDGRDRKRRRHPSLCHLLAEVHLSLVFYTHTRSWAVALWLKQAIRVRWSTVPSCWWKQLTGACSNDHWKSVVTPVQIALWCCRRALVGSRWGIRPTSTAPPRLSTHPTSLVDSSFFAQAIHPGGREREKDDDDEKTILTHVEDTEAAASTGDTLLCDGSEGSLELELVHTLVGRLAERGALGDLLLAVTPADSDPVNDVALLGLVAQSAGLVRTAWSGRTVDDVELSVEGKLQGERGGESL